HERMRAARIKSVIRNETDNSVFSSLTNTPFREPEETNVEIVQKLLSNPPLHVQGAGTDLSPLVVSADSLVVISEIGFLRQWHPSESIIWWVTDYDDNLPSTLYRLCSIILGLKFRKVKFRLFGPVPPRQGIRQEYGGPMRCGRLSSEFRQDQEQLKLGDNKWSG